MANYGPRGPRDSLVPFSPVPAEKSGENFEEHQVLEELGFRSTRASLKQESDAEFKRVAGSEDGVLTEERFIAVAAQLWAFDRRSARACFHASDADGSRRLNRHEYLLFREAFVHPASERADHEVVRRLQLRAIFHKYVLSRPGKRYSKEDDAMTRNEAFEWVRDLCAGDAHVRQVASSLLPLLKGDSSRNLDGETASPGCAAGPVDDEQLTLERFVGALAQDELAEHLRSHGLTVGDLTDCLRNPGRGHTYPHRYPRAVLDGRAETASLRSRRPGAPRVLAARVESSGVDPDAVNAEMELDPQVRAIGGWRGPLAPTRDAFEYTLATQVVEAAMQMARELPTQLDMLDGNWMPKGQALRRLLGSSNEVQQAYYINTLAKSCLVQLQAQPSLVRVTAPAKVFGDVHGQLRDLLLLFGLYGLPTHCGGDVQTCAYVFNGDWVDRGAHQLEVVCLLFALKTAYPAQIFLVRGNHEFRGMNEYMEEDGFYQHMQKQLPKQWETVYETLHSTFDWLPIAALVGGVVLVLHGGIGDGSWCVKDLEQVQRPFEQETEGCVLDALWSDPTDSDDLMRWGVHENLERGSGAGVAEFGPDVTADFCRRDNLSLIVRSHQYVRQGYKVMHGGHLITLFSARNYFGEESNDGAMLLLTPDVNGHLRVHAKRLVSLDYDEQAGSGFRRLYRRLARFVPCSPGCFQGICGGQVA